MNPDTQQKPDFHTYFMGIALAVRARADCTGNKVGAVLVRDRFIVATGYNGTAAGTLNCSEGGCHRCSNPDLYPSGSGLDLCTCLHAESNSLLVSAKFGISVKDSVCYTTMRPCFGCSKELLQAGITTVYYIHNWAHPDPAYQRQYEALQANFKNGVHHLPVPDPHEQWAVRSKRTST